MGVDLLCTDQSGMSGLHHAARFGHKDVVKFLLDNGKKKYFVLTLYHKNNRLIF